MSKEIEKEKRRERLTLTKNISNLIFELEKHHKKSRLNSKYLVRATWLLVVSTLLLVGLEIWKISKNEKIAEEKISFEKLSRTIELCDQFNKWFTGYELPRNDTTFRADLIEFKTWIYKKSKWIKVNKTKKDGIKTLLKNPYTDEFFNFFEKIKVSEKEGFINTKYFQNSFESIFLAIDTSDKPTVQEIIDDKRDSVKLNNIWDGFIYCRDTLMKK